MQDTSEVQGDAGHSMCLGVKLEGCTIARGCHNVMQDNNSQPRLKEMQRKQENDPHLQLQYRHHFHCLSMQKKKYVQCGKIKSRKEKPSMACNHTWLPNLNFTCHIVLQEINDKYVAVVLAQER